MAITPPYATTTNYGLGLWLDYDTPGYLALNTNWSTIDSAIWALSQSAQTIISAIAPVSMSGVNKVALAYNTTNFVLSASTHLNTVQDITTTSSPTFANLLLTGKITANEGEFTNDVIAHSNLYVGDYITDKLVITGSTFTYGSVRINQIDKNNYFYGLTIGDATQYWNILEGGANQLIIAQNQSPKITIMSASNEIKFGANTADTNLYRQEANYLRTDDLFHAYSLSASFATLTGQISSSGTGYNYLVGKTSFGQAKAGQEAINLYGHLGQSGSYSIYNNFSSGWAGSGWRIDQNITVSGSSGELDNLTVRGTLRVYELLINQIRATNGTLIVTSAAKVSSSVAIGGDSYQIDFEDPEGNGTCPFAVGDIVICQEFNLTSGSVDVIKRIVRAVATVNGTEVIIVPDGDLPVDPGVPAVGDVFVRIGSTTNTQRQGVVYLTSDENNSPYIDIINGVSSWADWTDKVKLKARLGKLDGLTSDNFGTLSGYGLYAKGGIYLESSGSSNSIVMKAGENTATLTMKQGPDTIFNFDTATATAKIAGWDFDNYKIEGGDEGATWNKLIMHASASEAYIVASQYQDSDTPFDGAFVVMGKMPALSPWVGETGIGARDAGQNKTYFILTDSQQKIAGWTFDENKLFTGTDIVLDGTAKKVSVAADKVKMYYTDATAYGVSSSLFHIGSYNVISGWSITNNSLFKTITSPDTRMISINTETTGSGNQFWLGTNRGVGFNVMYKSGSWAHSITMGEILTDVNGNGSATARSGWWGVQMLGAAGSSTPRTYFQMSGNDKTHKNIIAGWNFDYQKLWTGVSSASMVLNTSATAFIAATGKGFEVWDLNNPKMFIGSKTGSYLDWNSITANTLTISGSIFGSSFTAGSIFASYISASQITGSQIFASKFTTNYTFNLNTAGVDISGSYINVTQDNYSSTDWQTKILPYKITISKGTAPVYLSSDGISIDASGNPQIEIIGMNVPKYYGQNDIDPTLKVQEGDYYYNYNTLKVRMRIDGAWININ